MATYVLRIVYRNAKHYENNYLGEDKEIVKDIKKAKRFNSREEVTKHYFETFNEEHRQHLLAQSIEFKGEVK